VQRPANISGHEPVLRLVHFTDAHLRTEHDAPARFRGMLRHIRRNNPDISLFLNGGGSIYMPDGGHPSREYVEREWQLWKDCTNAELSDVSLRSCLGEGDLFYPDDATDPLHGKPCALRQLGMESAYYSFSSEGWHFCVLDSMHDGGGALGEEQMSWLKFDLDHNRHLPVLVLSHYPIAAFSTLPDHSAMHRDWEEILALFNANPNVKICLSGHTHLLDRVWYNGVKYCCNGSAGGHYWEPGEDGLSACKQTPPGYALVELYKDGSSRCKYVPYPIRTQVENSF
jgi:hypothetical protein